MCWAARRWRSRWRKQGNQKAAVLFGAFAPGGTAAIFISMLFLQGISRLRARPKGKKTDERLRSPFGNLRHRNFGEIPYWLRQRFCLVRAPPHNSAARLAMSFPPSAACKFLDLHPVNLRNLHLHLTKNPFASRPPHLCGVTLELPYSSTCCPRSPAAKCFTSASCCSSKVRLPSNITGFCTAKQCFFWSICTG